MRQTAKTQITDVRYARMVHVAAEKEKPRRRRLITSPRKQIVRQKVRLDINESGFDAHLHAHA